MLPPKKLPLPKELMDILGCPLCKADLQLNEVKNVLICAKCNKQYPIKNDIPLLLP